LLFSLTNDSKRDTLFISEKDSDFLGRVEKTLVAFLPLFFAIGETMSYSESVLCAAESFIAHCQKYPNMDRLAIAQMVCEVYEVEKLDLDEKVWEIKNKK